MAWDAAKPANNTALVSSEVRDNWAALEAAVGNPDTTPLAIKQATLAAGASFTGSATFGVPPTFKPGTSATADARITGLIAASGTAIGNDTAAEKDLRSVSVKANTLDGDGRQIRVHLVWKTAANANTKTLRFYFAGTSTTVHAAADNDKTMRAEITLWRTGASSQEGIFVRYLTTTINTAALSAMSGDLTTDLTLKVTGQSSSATANDIQLLSWAVEAL